MIIRVGSKNDIKRIAELEKLCFSDAWTEEMVSGGIGELPPVDDPKVAYSFYLVLEEEGAVQGYIGIVAVLDEATVTNVAVNPTFRRKHLGETLMRAMLEETYARGIRIWSLEVRVSNEPAIALYEKLGFEKVGVRKGYYEDNNEDAFMMVLNQE